MLATHPAPNTTSPGKEIVMPSQRTTRQRLCVQCSGLITGRRGSKYCSLDCSHAAAQAGRTYPTTHGMNKTLEHRAWTGLRGRCLNPNDKRYAGYGGRGITVCPEWDSFEQFYADMGPKPSPEHSLDRIDNDGPYAPWNCRWATRSEQQRNRRNSKVITYHGRTQAVYTWAEEIGIDGRILLARLRKGWPAEQVIETPLVPMSDRSSYRTTQRPEATHCRRGHPFDDANTYVLGHKRACRACRRAAIKRRQARSEIQMELVERAS